MPGDPSRKKRKVAHGWEVHCWWKDWPPNSLQGTGRGDNKFKLCKRSTLTSIAGRKRLLRVWLSKHSHSRLIRCSCLGQARTATWPCVRNRVDSDIDPTRPRRALLLHCSRIYSQVFWSLTLNTKRKEAPNNDIGAASGLMGDISVEKVNRESVKQLSTTSLNSINQGQIRQRPCIETRQVNKLWTDFAATWIAPLSDAWGQRADCLSVAVKRKRFMDGWKLGMREGGSPAGVSG